jgi:hypothetical protein
MYRYYINKEIPPGQQSQVIQLVGLKILILDHY